MGSHIVNGQFQSDKYPTCPPGKVPLSVKDTTAQDLIWEYARRRRAVDAEFADDLTSALKAAGFEPPTKDMLTVRIDYDDDGLMVVEKINELLVHRGLRFRDDGLDHDGFMVFTLCCDVVSRS
jgi:23S rRNA-/tRNA-specific pseudouridylate synthase